MANGTTVAVIRGGRVIWSRHTPAPPLVPRKGTVMADTATITTERRSWALALQAKERAAAAKAAVLTGGKRAAIKGREAIEFVRSTPAYSWFARMFTRALSMTRSLSDALGTVGICALVGSVVLSRQGQKFFHWSGRKLADAALTVVGYGTEGICKVLSWIPRKGQAWSAGFRNRVMSATAKVIGWTMTERAAKLSSVTAYLHHESWTARTAKNTAGTFVGLKLASTLPGYWKFAGYGVVAALAVCSIFADGLDRVFRVKVREGWSKLTGLFRKAEVVAEQIVDAPAGPEVKVTVHNPNGVKLAGPAAHVAADVANEIAVEKHQNGNRQAGESAQAIRNAEAVARMEMAATQEFIDANIEEGNERAKAAHLALVQDTDAIAQVTADFFDEETKYSSREQLLNDLKGRVYPIFKHHLSSKLTSKAARGFSVVMADRFGVGEGVYGEPGSNKELREAIAIEALGFIDDPTRATKQLVSA